MPSDNPLSLAARLPWAWRRPIAGYGIALAAFLATFLARELLSPWLASDRDFVIFIPGLIATTFLAGLGPGIFCAILSGLGLWYFFLPPLLSFAITLDSAVAFSTYVLAASMSVALVYWLRVSGIRLDAERARAEALARREKLLRDELQHRGKNLFAVIAAVAHQTLRGELQVESARQAFLARLNALARTDNRLTSAGLQPTPIADLLVEELQPFQGRIKLDGADVRLPAKPAQNFSLALHELATNAAKYGALSVPDGRVEIRWSVAPASSDSFSEVVTVRWREIGGPPVVPPTRSGFGSLLLRSTLRNSRIEYATDGLRYEADIEVPLPRSADENAQAAQRRATG